MQYYSPPHKILIILNDGITASHIQLLTTPYFIIRCRPVASAGATGAMAASRKCLDPSSRCGLSGHIPYYSYYNMAPSKNFEPQHWTNSGYEANQTDNRVITFSMF